MSQATRPKPTRMTVCDLCDQEIDESEHAGEVGSLTHGWLAHKVETPRTKRAWLQWPPAGRDRRMTWEEKRKPENRERRYDFHADCILQLVEDAITARTTPAAQEARPA